jgi:DNA-binding transcriptional ArsR family regulator
MEDVEKDRERAEVFDALGHPTRISILKALSEEPLGFADLKKRMGIDSSGHLQHHLSKLGGLIKTDEHGKYCISDQGKDALFAVQTVERVAESGFKETATMVRAYGLKTRTILTSLVVILAITSLVSGFYISNVMLTQSQYFYDVVKGSPLNERYGGVSLPFFEIPPAHSFNYTAQILLYPIGYGYAGPSYSVFGSVSPPVRNSTFYLQSFVGFKIKLNNKTRAFEVFVNPLIGPNGSIAEIVDNPYGFPPFETSRSTGSSRYVGGGLSTAITLVSPVSVSGNYTFSVTNISNSTISGQMIFWVSTVTMESKSLKGGETFPAIMNEFSERVARVYWMPQPTYLFATGAVIISPIAIVLVSFYLINRKG